MPQHDFGGLDTPRTNAGDATYLDRQPDFFDMTQEPSFQSPSKDNNVLQQMRNNKAGGLNLRTPRGSRPALGDRRNQLPQGIGGAEFTPMLKSATRNSARRRGKENQYNVLATPGLGRINEDADLTNIPVESSLYGPSRGSTSYLDATMPEVADSSITSTPIALPPRRNVDKGPLNDGNQLSLREQENVIDRIEKENFGLKLKIHFLEEALRKAGPGFSEAALKENTELKVDKVTLQRDLQKYKKHLTNAEKDLEVYSQQILEMKEKAKKKYADESQKIEIERLKQDIEEREVEVEDLQRQLEQGNRDSDKIEQLQDEIGDLEADLREKDREINEREEEIESIKEKLEDAEDKWKTAEQRLSDLEDKAQSSEELEEAKETIEDLEASVRRLELEADEMKEKLDQAVADKERAENDLEELQDEMSNKSVVTKGLSRQLEEKLVRLESDLQTLQEKYAFLEQQNADKDKYANELKTKANQLLDQKDSWEEERENLMAKLENAERDLIARTDEKNLLQLRHDALGDESTSLQRDVARLQKQIEQLEDSLDQEKSHALRVEQEVRDQLKDDIDRLNDDISDLQAEVREKDNLYDNDSEKWENEKHNLESERDRAEERAAGLQRTIEKLREAEGSLSDKETRLQEALNSEAERHQSEQAVLSRQIDDLRQDLDARQAMLTDLRAEVSAVRDELRQSQLDYQSQSEKLEALEDEVEVLQATLDDESEQANQNLAQSKQECEQLRHQLRSLQDEGFAQVTSSEHTSRQANESLSRLQTQLSDANAQLGRVGREKQSLQDQLANLNVELHSLRGSLAEAKAEREDAEDELRRLRDQDNHTFRLDQERIDLRAAKVKLDSEVRRLRDENRSLSDQRESIEKSLEDEIERAAAEEERLNHEILSLQSRMRQSSGNESQELAAARRTIRDLERKIDEYAAEIAINSTYPAAAAASGAEGNSELSLMRRDLSSARQRELELMNREAGHKDAVRTLKRQIADLERKLHEAEMTQLVKSPNNSSVSNSASARKQEISELRHQLTVANKSIHELRQKLKESDRATSKSTAEHEAAMQDLQAQLDELEDQKLNLEDAAADLEQAMVASKAQHDKAVKKLEHQIYKLQHSSGASTRQQKNGKAADSDAMDPDERNELRAMLHNSQTEIQALEHDIRVQAAALKSHEATKANLRQKLDKVRNERAAYRNSAQKLQQDCQRLEEGAREAIAWIESHKADSASRDNDKATSPASAAYVVAKEMAALGRTSIRSANLVLDVVDQSAHEAVIRAADEAAKRHEKELRGLAMQMQWMQARWERETKLRGDAAFAKKFLELKLGIAEACNKADLRILSQIHKQLGIKSPEALLQTHRGSSSATAKPRTAESPADRAKRNLRVFATVLRATARMRISARAWSKHEKTRRKLADAWEETKRREPVRRWDSATGGDHSGKGQDDDDNDNDNGGNGADARQEKRVQGGRRVVNGKSDRRAPLHDGNGGKKKRKSGFGRDEDVCVEFKM